MSREEIGTTVTETGVGALGVCDDIFLKKKMLRRKRKLEQETNTDTTTSTDTTTYIEPYSAQWWYNRMSKQRRMRMHPDLKARLTYNTATTRVELDIIVPKLAASSSLRNDA